MERRKVRVRLSQNDQSAYRPYSGGRFLLKASVAAGLALIMTAGITTFIRVDAVLIFFLMFAFAIVGILIENGSGGI